MKNLFLMLLTALTLCSCAEKSTFTLWQLPSQADDHGNSYVIRTANGHIIAMDGGKAPEADYLRGFLAGLGNKVDAWIVTHPHGDHIDAMMELMEQRQGLTIGKIYHSRYTDNLIDGEAGSAENTRKFYSMLDGATDFEVVDCALGPSHKGTNRHPKAPPPDTIMVGIRFQHMNLWGTHALSLGQ